MPGLLELSRHKGDLHRELLRRIGYTEGLFHVFRFANLVTELGGDLPLPTAALDVRIPAILGDASGSGRSYKEGIRNVLLALRLLERAGNRITLGTRGRAIRALSLMYGHNSPQVAALMSALIVEADGDYVLNLLQTEPSEFFGAVLACVSVKRQWFSAQPNSAVARIGLGYLDEVERSFTQGRRSTSGAGSGRRPTNPGMTEHTIRHTTTPRLGWIRDLGLNLPERADRILSQLEQAGQYTDEVVALGLSDQVANALSVESAPRLTWPLIWAISAPTKSVASIGENDFVGFVTRSYEFLRLRSFNQAEVEALYLSYAASEAAAGRVCSEDAFTDVLDGAVAELAGQMWRLSARRGGVLSGYVALKQ